MIRLPIRRGDRSLIATSRFTPIERRDSQMPDRCSYPAFREQRLSIECRAGLQNRDLALR